MSLFFKQAPALLLLEDGSTFAGFVLGVPGLCVGEVVFNTAMTGYQEIMTDPSYAQQIIAFSYPHIGNTGINLEDSESSKVWASGVVVHEICDQPSNYRSVASVQTFLSEQGIVGISGVDTRRLVAHIRSFGAQKSCIVSGDYTLEEAQQALAAFPGLNHQNLTLGVTTSEPYSWAQGTWSAEGGRALCAAKHHVLVYDFGVKRNILRHLVDRGCQVTVVPADYPPEQALQLKPDALVLSNGPGDPRACHEILNTIEVLMRYPLPILGICLGYQLLALASGCQIYKMKVGHHGANHPVMNLETREVFISSQNHGFTVDKDHLPASLRPTFVSLFDQTLQGFSSRDQPFFGIQGHPEAGPGPGDMAFIFDELIQRIEMSVSHAQTN